MLRHAENKNQTTDTKEPSTFLRGQLEFFRRKLTTLWPLVRSMKSLFLLVFLVSVVLFALIGLGKSDMSNGSWWGGGGGCIPRNCSLYQWTTFGSCSKTCGWGQLVQRREIKRYSRCGGTPCPPPYSQQRRKRVSCYTQCCRVNCSWWWSSWSPCRGCGMSQQTRVMYVSGPRCGGTPCPTARRETRSCNTGK